MPVEKQSSSLLTPLLAALLVAGLVFAGLVFVRVSPQGQSSQPAASSTATYYPNVTATPAYPDSIMPQAPAYSPVFVEPGYPGQVIIPSREIPMNRHHESKH